MARVRVMRTNSLIAMLAATPLLVAASPQPVRMQPSSGWVLDYAADSCKLSRAFGAGVDETVLQFESTAPGQMSMIVIGRPLRTTQEQVAAKFLPVGDELVIGDVRLTVTQKPVVAWSDVPLLPASFTIRDAYKELQRKAHPEVRPPSIDLKERDEALGRAAGICFRGDGVGNRRPAQSASDPRNRVAWSGDQDVRQMQSELCFAIGVSIRTWRTRL